MCLFQAHLLSTCGHTIWRIDALCPLALDRQAQRGYPQPCALRFGDRDMTPSKIYKTEQGLCGEFSKAVHRDVVDPMRVFIGNIGTPGGFGRRSMPVPERPRTPLRADQIAADDGAAIRNYAERQTDWRHTEENARSVVAKQRVGHAAAVDVCRAVDGRSTPAPSIASSSSYITAASWIVNAAGEEDSTKPVDEKQLPESSRADNVAETHGTHETADDAVGEVGEIVTVSTSDPAVASTAVGAQAMSRNARAKGRKKKRDAEAKQKKNGKSVVGADFV